MPTFSDIDVEITQKIDIDFEVYCNTCGAGLCNESDTIKNISRNCLQVSVNVCPDCMKEKNEEIKRLESYNSELEIKVYNLEQEIERLINE